MRTVPRVAGAKRIGLSTMRMRSTRVGLAAYAAGMFLSHLECTETGERVEANALQTLSPSGMPLQARYDLDAVRAAVTREQVAARRGGMWRWREVMPLPKDGEVVTLGEGDTPLLRLTGLGEQLEMPELWVKDEACNPTGSFKARGLSAGVTMAKHLGARMLAVPSAGNAGGALAAYGARAGLDVQLAMPRDVPESNVVEAEACGAHIELIAGTIADCGKWIRAFCEEHGAFDLSTLKEPYRVEGKKTMGYELCEQFDWSLPDAILYPAGGGTGLVGMWKAFHELRELGWIDESVRFPRMYAVQATGCAPIVEAFDAGADHATAPEHPATCASGLRVPTPIGDRWMLRVLRESEGGAAAIDDEELILGSLRAASSDGIFFAPEGGALVAALVRFLDQGVIRSDERVVLFNTGTGLKYLECFR